MTQLSGKEISAKAFAEIKASGHDSTRRDQVYAMLKQHGAMTGGEIWEVLKSQEGQSVHRLNSNNTVTRCIELSQMGMVEKVGTRTCTSTQKTATIWKIIEGAVPKKLIKKPTHKEVVAFLQARIRILETENADLRQQGAR